MAINIELNDLANLQNENTAVTKINQNNATIENALTDALSRTGVTPNQMEANFDMNGNQILNLPAPATPTSPLRLQDLETFNGGGTIANIPAGGTTGQSLQKKSNTDYDLKWAGNVTSVGVTMPGDFTVVNSPVTLDGTIGVTWATAPTGTGAVVRANAPALVNPTGITKANVGLDSVDNTSDATKNSATATLTNKTIDTAGPNTIAINGNVFTATAGTATITVPNTTDTLVGRATTDTLTNKTLTSPVINTPTGIVKADVGLGNVDNTSDSTKNSATATLTNKTIDTASNTLKINGNTLTATAGTATLTMPNSTQTIVGRTTTDTLTNKTLTSPTINQPIINGITDGSVAASGVVGQYIEQTSSSGAGSVTMANNVSTNVLSISLTAGDWDVRALTTFVPDNGLSVTFLKSTLSTASATPDNTPGRNTSLFMLATTYPGGTGTVLAIPSYRFNLTATTTIYLVASATFTNSGTVSAFGSLSARRVR